MQQLRSFGISTTELLHVFEVITEKENVFAEDILRHQGEAQVLQVEWRRLGGEVRKIQAGVDEHLATIIALENKRKGLGKCLQACRSLLSPIRRLPMEVLREVFLRFCSSVLVSEYEVSVPPLKLAAVCGGWRKLALSTPQLWTRIELDTRGLSLDRLRRCKSLANLAFKHSEHAPLNLRLRSSSRPNTHEIVVSIVKTTARHSHHWHRAALDISNSLLNKMNRSIRELPLFESLTVCEALPPFDMTNVAPKLRCLHLRLKPADLKVPWDRISELKLECKEDVPFTGLLPWIEHCKSLRKLHIAGFCWPDEVSEDEDRQSIEEIYNHSCCQIYIIPVIWNMCSARLPFLNYPSPLYPLSEMTCGPGITGIDVL